MHLFFYSRGMCISVWEPNQDSLADFPNYFTYNIYRDTFIISFHFLETFIDALFKHNFFKHIRDACRETTGPSMPSRNKREYATKFPKHPSISFYLEFFPQFYLQLFLSLVSFCDIVMGVKKCPKGRDLLIALRSWWPSHYTAKRNQGKKTI